MRSQKEGTYFKSHGCWAMVFFVFFITLSHSVLADDDHRDKKRFTITDAEWEVDDSQLKIEGTHKSPGTKIVVRSARSGALLGSAIVERDREWELELLVADNVPCRVRAHAGDKVSERKVKHAPRDCDKTTGNNPPSDDPINISHVGFFSNYEGSKTCNQCHLETTRHVHASQHYQWNGPAPYAVNLDWGGKMGSINDFCGFPDIDFIGQLINLKGETVDGGCSVCHVGRGLKPAPEQTVAQLENIDCLVCHSNTYKRKVEKVDGQFLFVPAPEKMQVSLIEAITNIQRIPDKGTCINCHAYAGGGCNNKRGDIEEAHHDAPKWFDVHLASKENGGAGLHCLSCHKSENHRIAGRGTDLQATDLDVPVRCTNCHDERPHDRNELDKHVARVDCTVCHIPAYARITSTDMIRDLSKPAEVVESTQLYEPHNIREANVVPKYRFFNGFSRFYEFATPAIPGDSGRIVMSEPVGDVSDPNAKLFAFKHHKAVQPRDRDTNYIVPLKMGLLFQTGDVAAAIKLGAELVGWPLASGYEFVPTERYMGIFHEVAPKEDALRCSACHRNEGRINFAALGYTPKITRNGVPLCMSCHKDESDEWEPGEFFYEVHEKHVDDKGLNCAECHSFNTAP